MAAALVAMVARLTIGRKKYAAMEGEMNEILERAEGLRAKLTQAVTEDAAAYKAVITAFRLPKNTPEEVVNRSLEIEASTLQAAQVPLKVADLCVKVLELVIPVASHGNQNALSDAGTAGAMAAAALSGAGFNVRTNVASLQDQVTAQQLVVKLEELEDVAGNLLERIHSEITARKGFS
jgi:glutamate formiminotransferase/formiminotetrahydrofolate cyclodeaminase